MGLFEICINNPTTTRALQEEIKRNSVNYAERSRKISTKGAYVLYDSLKK